MSLLTVDNLTLSYEKQAVTTDLSFTVEPGDCFCILGENGSGKSTLVKALMGLIRPDKGSIRFDGIRRAEIGYLPQQSAAQKDFPASVGEIVLSGCLVSRLFARATAADRACAEENMALLGITGLKNRSFSALSGGQQQRVLLARAFCAAKKLLVLDEPVTGLDPVVSAELYGIMEKKNREDGLTVITVSHAPERALRTATRILHLGGTERFFGTPADYLASPIGRRYLGAAQEGKL